MKDGKHLIIDAYGCDRDALWDVQLIKDVLLSVTYKLGLKPLSDVLIYEVDDTMICIEDTGITGGIIFMESHFTFHSFPERNYFSADIYSCKDFDTVEVTNYIKKCFTPEHCDETILIRGSKL